MNMKRIALILIVVLLTGQAASAYYVPADHKAEAKSIKGDAGMYRLAMKYGGERWAFDILRQLAQNYTNSGKISDLAAVMKKYA